MNEPADKSLPEADPKLRRVLARVPPPLPFALAIAAGLLLDRRVPLRIVPWAAAGIARTAGLGLLVTAAGLAAACLAMFVHRRTTIVPHRRAAALVTSGPYRLSRNPMYVSLAFVAVGVAAFENALWPALLVTAPLLLVSAVHIPFEERTLREAFRDDYRRYAVRVRRWL